MKYMSFNSSCSYAGIANLLELKGHHVEDREIALKMNLPDLFHRDEKLEVYQSGALLQTKEWFDLYLNPIGFRLNERRITKTEALRSLEPESMLQCSSPPAESTRSSCSKSKKTAGQF